MRRRQPNAQIYRWTCEQEREEGSLPGPCSNKLLSSVAASSWIAPDLYRPQRSFAVVPGKSRMGRQYKTRSLQLCIVAAQQAGCGTCSCATRRCETSPPSTPRKESPQERGSSKRRRKCRRCNGDSYRAGSARRSKPENPPSESHLPIACTLPRQRR
jgi:hypothetical protein